MTRVELLFLATIRYPRDRLEIQVLDDSTDETQGIARACVERLRESGVDIHYMHRDNRSGYKAGALQEGLKVATGELISVFDADFVPSSDFLLRSVHFFTDAAVGMVQVRWEHPNRDYSHLTQAQPLLEQGRGVYLGSVSWVALDEGVYVSRPCLPVSQWGFFPAGVDRRLHG